MENSFIQEGAFVSGDSVVEPGAVIYAPAHISGNSHICRGAHIMPGCILIGAHVGENTTVISSTLISAHVGADCTIGPYAYLRLNAYVGNRCRVGDFVEIKSSTLGDGTKAAHLAYIGDAEVGKEVNIGCGAVFCNYDGKVKSKTVVKDKVFIGANCNLIAPLEIGEGAFIAAGTTVDGNLDGGDFCIGRSRPYIKKGGAKDRYKGG